MCGIEKYMMYYLDFSVIQGEKLLFFGDKIRPLNYNYLFVVVLSYICNSVGQMS